MKKIFAFSILPILLLTLISCGGGSSSGGGGYSVDVSGTWKGTGNTPQTGTLPTTLNLSQSGNNVSGTWDGHAVTGTVSGNQLTLNLSPWTQDGVEMTGGGISTINENTMSGNLWATAKKGNVSVTINGTFTATRSTSNAKYSTGMSPGSGLVSSFAKAIAN